MASQEQLLATLTPDTREAVERLLFWAEARGSPAKIVSAYRTCAQQNDIYVSRPWATKAAGCHSWHVHGRAVDLARLDGQDGPGAFEAFGVRWRELGGKWGGDFKDWGHFEYHPDRKITEFCPYPHGDMACPSGLYKPGRVLSVSSDLRAMYAGIGVALLGLGAAAWVVWSKHSR